MSDIDRSQAIPSRSAAPESRREVILDATIHVIALAGIRNLTHRAVAARAGVSHALVRYHFGTIDELIEQALIFSLSRPIELVLPPASRVGLVELARHIIDSVYPDKDVAAFQIEAMMEARRNPLIRRRVGPMIEYYKSFIKVSLQSFDLPHDRETVQHMYAVLEGIGFQGIVMDDFSLLDEATARLRDLEAGIRKRETEGQAGSS